VIHVTEQAVQSLYGGAMKNIITHLSLHQRYQDAHERLADLHRRRLTEVGLGSEIAAQLREIRELAEELDILPSRAAVAKAA
jgi:hypothetical protein